ncbi:acetyl-CoA carboxylase biotin carboxyl carrier protein [Sporolactobacillus sp. THM7-4]|nr:acetyl-CoA carboxylase biotin carboxyl carrier protein [Sporolactobacillus sp. THM7-4]
MLNIDDIKTLIRLINESSIHELKYEADKIKLTLKKDVNPTAHIQQETVFQKSQSVNVTETPVEVNPGLETDFEPSSQTELKQIVSPMVGTFYAASSPDTDPFVKTGSKVDDRTVVCIIEAMKLFNEIEAEIKGTIVKVMAEDGQLVEYGQPLFLVQPD